MRLRKLLLNNFGPFRSYEIEFTEEDAVCVLLTGKNNEGKSTVLNAIKLLDSATRVLNQTKQEIRIGDDFMYKLLLQDTAAINTGRMIHNYEERRAEIRGEFADDLVVTVYLDPSKDLVYADYAGRVPVDVKQIFGFIPALGLLNEDEEVITKSSYLRASLNTSLAPRHLRNHLFQILTPEEFALVKEIVNSSWEGIELLNFEFGERGDRIYCYYKEYRFTRELSWAGQGLQVWIQIITHLVRLRNSSILILDEPEINLHPEKQSELVRVLREYYGGSILIATHSVELMNNVHVSHIINVQKRQSRPQVKSTADRNYLELVRSQVGSHFNFIASQFEYVDIIVFTEDIADFKIIDLLAKAYDIREKAFNIPLYGFSEYRKSVAYKRAYELLIGKQIEYSVVLDRDYYPEEYLQGVKNNLDDEGIRTVFTPGKEIENLFLYPPLLNRLVPPACRGELKGFLDDAFQESYLACNGNYVSLHQQFLSKRLDVKTIIQDFVPKFDKIWKDPQERFKIIAGKHLLKSFRTFYRERLKENLSDAFLTHELAKARIPEVEKFIRAVYASE